MRRKKMTTPPMLGQQEPVKPSTEHTELERLQATVDHLQQMLLTALPNTTPLTPAQIISAGWMVVNLMYFKKVLPQFWADHHEAPMRLVELAQQIAAEAKVSRIENLPEATAKVLNESAALSIQEIRIMREECLKTVKLLVEIPLPGTSIH